MVNFYYYFAKYSNSNILTVILNMFVLPEYYKAILNIFKKVIEILFWFDFYKLFYKYYSKVIKLFTNLKILKGFIVIYFIYLYKIRNFFMEYNYNHDILFFLTILMSILIFFSNTVIDRNLNSKIIDFINNFNKEEIVKKNNFTIWKKNNFTYFYNIFRSYYDSNEEKIFKNYFKYSITLNNAITTGNVLFYILFLILNYILHNNLLKNVLEPHYENKISFILIYKVYLVFYLYKLFFLILGNFSLILFNSTLFEIKFPYLNKYLINKCNQFYNPFHKGGIKNILEHFIASFNLKFFTDNNYLYSDDIFEEKEDIIKNDLKFMDNIKKINFKKEYVNWNNIILVLRFQIDDDFSKNLLNLFKKNINENGKINIDSDTDSDEESDEDSKSDNSINSKESVDSKDSNEQNEIELKENKINLNENENEIKNENNISNIGEIKNTNNIIEKGLEDNYEI